MSSGSGGRWGFIQATDTGERALVDDAFRRINTERGGNFTVPVTHRDGHRLWVSGSFNEISDEEGARLVVGTFREVVAAGGEDSLEDLASGLMTWLEPGGGYPDDVAMVLYRHPAPLELAFPADTGELRPARSRLRRWLDSCVPDTLTAQDSLVAAGEAVANAIEHGHRDRPGEVRLRASATAERVWLAVSDSGSWLPPGPEPTPFRGKGITLMRAMMDDVSIDSSPAGTTVSMNVRITRDDPA